MSSRPVYRCVLRWRHLVQMACVLVFVVLSCDCIAGLIKAIIIIIIIIKLINQGTAVYCLSYHVAWQAVQLLL